MSKFTTALRTVLKYSIALLVLAMTAVIFLQVIVRYFLHRPLAWSEELARYLFVYLTFFGAAAAVPKSEHVVVDILLTLVKGRTRRIMEVLIDLLMFAFFAILFVSVIKLYPSISKILTTGTNIPYSCIYTAIPIGCVLSFVFLAEKLINDARGLTSGKEV